MNTASLYEKVLEELGDGALPSLPVPRPSASVVLWRGSGDELEVFWVQRAFGMAFMGGWHAFPGGGVSSADRLVAPATQPVVANGASSRAAMPEAVTADVDLEPILAPGVAAAALRELFEETGVLPGLVSGVASLDRVRALRRALGEREVLFSDVLAELDLEGHASRMVYAGRWLTPPLGPMRFDNRFFLLHWPEEESVQPVADSRESAAGEWIRPRQALARWLAGDVLTAPPILHLMRVLAEDGPDAGLARLHLPEEANLGAHRNVEFRPGVIMLPVRTPTLPPASFTNCYLLGTESCVLVDPGSSDRRQIEWLVAAVEAAREKLGRRLREIWLTHHHPDHVGGCAALRERLGVPLAAHALTAERLAGSVTVDREICDGEAVDLGAAGDSFTVRALHTPGHARGHLCFLHEELGSLLTGDVIAGLGTIVIDPPEGDMQQYVDTLDELRELSPRTLFPGHGPPILDATGKIDEYRQHRSWREERILAAWNDGLRDPSTLLERVYDDVPRQAHPLASRQIVAHLARLRELGRLVDEAPGSGPNA